MAPKRPIRSVYYDNDVDFSELAKNDEEFRVLFEASNRRLDFHKPEIQVQLTRSTLSYDFGIDITLPSDRLCPPVPVRWNYVRWLQNLLDTTSHDYLECYDPERRVVGLDVGVGASCIYPLLACTSRAKWYMYGTDIDEHSFEFATKNATSNEAGARIMLTLTAESDDLLNPLDEDGIERLDFVMTNPPFFPSKEQMEMTYEKSLPPHAVYTGSENESICEGGDLGFVSRILDESLRLRERVQWYTAMMGTLTSAHALVAKLKQNDIHNFAVTNLAAGQKTKRWVVAWSFQGYRPANKVSRGTDLPGDLLALSTEKTIYAEMVGLPNLERTINDKMRSIDVKWDWNPESHQGVVQSKYAAWNRKARHNQQRGLRNGPVSKRIKLDVQEDEDEGMGEDGDDGHVAFAAKITFQDALLEIRWLRGSDHNLFISFYGMLKTTLKGLDGRKVVY